MQSKEQQTFGIKYIVLSFRTKKSYLVFLILQLILAFVIVVTALLTSSHFRSFPVLILECVLFLMLCFDLWISQGSLFRKKTNILDFILLIIFFMTLIFLFSYGERQEQSYDKWLQTDDIIIIVLIICRYVLQVTRIVVQIKKVRVNRLLHGQIKKVDLNIQLPTKSPTECLPEDSIQTDKKIRQKIVAKHTKFNQEPQS